MDKPAEILCPLCGCRRHLVNLPVIGDRICEACGHWWNELDGYDKTVLAERRQAREGK